MSEETLVDHSLVYLEPKVQDYVQVRNPKTTVQFLVVLVKFEESYSCKKMQESRHSGNLDRRGWNESRRSDHDDRQRNWKNSEVLHRLSNGRNNYRGNYESGRQRNQWFESRKGLNRGDRRFDRVYQSGNGVQCENFRRGDRRNRGSSTNFSRGNQRRGSRLNVSKVRDDQNDHSRSVKEVPSKLSAICMSPVELPYVPILSNETFTKALWDTDKPGLTHVLYHEIDTGDKPPVVSRPYLYDRVKHSILDYHVEKILKEGFNLRTRRRLCCVENISGYRWIIRKRIDLPCTTES
ncbi:uncharacterized protein TNCV_2381151 [Trichonephila clavipes]|nr:uncharacterized protein TNCV_2381151 [Trichonephila clavipes]